MGDKFILNTDSQLDSTLCIPESRDISFGDTLKGSIGVNWTSSLLEGALFIVSNGTYEIENSYWQLSVDLLTRTFDGVAKMNGRPPYFFHGLIKAYADLYNIDLHLIVLYNEKYVIIDKSNFFEPNEEPYNREKHAFIWCTADNTVYSPLYIKDVNERTLTVFKTDEVFAWRLVQSFVQQVNQELLNTAQNHTEQHSNVLEDDLSHMAIDDTLSSTNRSSSSTTLQPEAAPRVDTFIKRMLLQIGQLTDSLTSKVNNTLLRSELLDFNVTNLNQLSPQESADLIQQRLMLISEVVQMTVEQISQNNGASISTHIVAEISNDQNNAGLVESNGTNYFSQTDQNSADVQPPALTHLSNTTQVPEIESVVTTTQLQYDAPEVLIQPKGQWHCRNMKDLGRHRIPLLAGEGPQRTLIQVKVPREGIHPMYLGVKTQTHDNQDHRSKVLVLEHTNVNMDLFSNDNNLNRLQFDECNQMDYFDPVNRCVFLSISNAEHEAGKKDVRIHMFNLYQSGSITRDIINVERLDICKLAFWLCTLQDGIYQPVSAASLSNPIEED